MGTNGKNIRTFKKWKNRKQVILKDSIFWNELWMHWVGGIRSFLLWKAEAQTFSYSFRKSSSHYRNLQCVVKYAVKNQVRLCLPQLRSGPRSCALIPAQYQTAAEMKSRVSLHMFTHKKMKKWGLNRTGSERERGSRAPVCKPLTPPCVTKVSKEMCTKSDQFLSVNWFSNLCRPNEIIRYLKRLHTIFFKSVGVLQKTSIT